MAKTLKKPWASCLAPWHPA